MVALIFRPNRANAKNGTNFTFRYNKKALFDALVVSIPIAWNAKPRKVYTPSSAPARHIDDDDDDDDALSWSS